jgi:arylsulfatase A-like enzyme
VKPGRLAGLASGIDVAPTLLSLAGVAAPSTMEGRSLLEPEDRERVVFAETAIWLGGPAAAPPGAIGYPGIIDLLEVEEGSHALVLKERYEQAVVTAKIRAARQGPWQATYMPTSGAPRWKLFDLSADPFAQRESSARYPEKTAELAGELRAWLARDRLRWLDVNDRVVARYEQ